MKKFAGLLLLAAMAAVPALAQDKYPVQVVPVGKGPYTFPQGYKTDFSKVQIMVPKDQKAKQAKPPQMPT